MVRKILLTLSFCLTITVVSVVGAKPAATEKDTNISLCDTGGSALIWISPRAIDV